MTDYEVRNGQRVAPTCPECGCRLYQPYDYKGIWMHYQGEQFITADGYLDLTDKRGHKCKSRYQMAGIYRGSISFTGTGPFVIAPIK